MFVSVRVKETRNSMVWVLDGAHESLIKSQLPKDTMWELFRVDSAIKKLEKSEHFKKSLAKATL